jgi:acyl carrier protein
MNSSFSFFQKLIQEQFVGSFASAYDKIDEWTSMQSLIVVSTIDEHFDVLMSHEELKNVTSLEALHEKVLQKMES